MPKVSLESARARDHEILDKLGRVQQAAQSHKQKTKLNQQRHEWIEQARVLTREARKLEDDLKDAVSEMGTWPEVKDELQVQKADSSSAAEVWLQVSGLRQLLAQLRLRDPQRLREAPQQAWQLQEILSSMAVAVNNQNQQLTSEAALLEEECSSLRSQLRCDMDGLSDRSALQDRCDLSDEEDDLLQNIGDGEEAYRRALEELNVQVSASLTELEQEMGRLLLLSELRRKRAGWDDDAHFRFLHIKKEFQACPATVAGLGLSSLAWKKQQRWRRAVEGSTEAPGAGLQERIQRIAKELRKLESITSAYSQIAPYGFPQKSTPEGLAAMNELEHLINGELELDNKEAQLLVASLQHEKSEFGQIVSKALHILREGQDHPDFPAAQKIIDLLGRSDGNGDTHVDPTPAWPLPPSESDPAPNAQNARWPILAALDQTCKDGERSLGLAEAELYTEQGHRSQPKVMTLKKILKAAPSHKVLGTAETPITGVVDVMERAISGDLLLVEVDEAEGFDQEFISSTLEEADSREVSAVVFLAETVDLKQVEVSWEGEQRTFLKAATVLPRVTKGQASALFLARAFFATQKLGRKMMKIAVVGDHLEVRSASWLLFKMLEVYAGASKTGFINNRCSMIAQSSLGISGMLTSCAVEEILAGMNAAEVDFCVAEVLPSSDSFDHVDFDLVVDLGGDATISAARVVSPKKGKSETKRKHKVSYSFEIPRVQVPDLEEYAKLKKNELIEELESRGVDVSPTSLKNELLEKLQELLASTDPAPRPSKTEKNGKNLHANFTSVGLRGLELNLMGLGMDEPLSLPSLGLCSPNAIIAAICAAYVLAQDATTAVTWQHCLAKMPQIPPPPATLELFTAPSTGIAGVLHQASSPKEVKLALEAMAEVMNDRKATFTVVFGCDGEVSRGDRAKYAWALAEHCDRIVLTSASPGVEPPMQIIEDILEAIRGYRTWKKMKTLLEVFVVADRADAIKLGAITPKRDGEEPDVTLVFGSDQDSYDATDESGQVRSWLFHDRRLLTEALGFAKELREDGTKPAWLAGAVGKRFVLPGRSLHWSYGIEISSDGHMQMFL
eukprot:s163_g15.t1